MTRLSNVSEFLRGDDRVHHVHVLSQGWGEGIGDALVLLMDEEHARRRSDEGLLNMWSDPSAQRALESCSQMLGAVPAYRCWELKRLRGKNTSVQAKEHSGTPKQNGTFSTSNTGFLKKCHPAGKRKHAMMCNFIGCSVSSKNEPGQMKANAEY